ncbi:MAG: histidine kinase [Arachidicoccus sp.]|nr:histidine kinase [Arachidicoccus sp.]
MQKTEYKIIFALIAGTILVLFLSIVIIISILRYKIKQQNHAKEKQIMRADFEQNILQSRLEMQEQTFNNISQEIHDNVGQVLSLAKVQLSIVEQSETSNKELIADIKANISNALNDLRDIAKSLSSGRLHQLTLVQAIDQELQRINHSGLIQTQLNVSGAEYSVAEQKKVILFRMIQECFQNILKHAKATRIVVNIEFDTISLRVKIADNGIGFNPDEKYAATSGLGLQNIVTRAELIGGTAAIFSEPQQGTHIILNIPHER